MGFLLSPAACQKSPEPPAIRPAAERASVPDFTLKDLSGNTVALSQLKGKPVFLDFWATWCGPCRMSMPLVQKLHEDFGDRLQILGLNLDDDPSSVGGFVKRMGVTYPILLAGGSGVDGQYGVSGIPSFLLLDKEGRAVDGWTGFDPRYGDDWRKTIERVLAEK
jgi:thiol-disulfide isomerase/thioredoxin